jgi:integration host factor subunit beta
MTKAELINALRDENDLTKNEATEVVGIFFDEMSNTLSKGGRIEIRGLCSIYVKKYRGYTGRNPRTGQKVRIKQKKLPFFKSGRELKDRVDK